MTVRTRFPHRRSDGSLSVAARFTVAGDAAPLREYVANWQRARPDDLDIALEVELASGPQVVEREGSVVDVVFEGRPASKRWKELMVDLARHVPRATNATFECFFDLVADRPQPASLRLAERLRGT